MGLTARVLVVQAEESVRTLIRQTIEPEGCDVVEAADVPEALSALPSLRKPIDLVVADLIEPRIVGPSGLMRRVGVRCRLLLLSLFSGAPVVPAAYAQQIVVLQNPYRADALREKVRELLARSEK